MSNGRIILPPISKSPYIRQPSVSPPKRPQIIRSLTKMAKRSQPLTRRDLAEKDSLPYKDFNTQYTYMKKKNKQDQKHDNTEYKYIGENGSGLKFQNIVSKQELFFPNKTAAHLYMIQKAWSGGKNRTKKNKTNKK